MKRLFIVILVLVNFQSFAQTFKIIDVETSEYILYPQAKEKYLNKEFDVSFNENSISVTSKEIKEPLILEKINATTYSLYISTKQNSGPQAWYFGNVNKFFNIVFKFVGGKINSMEFKSSEWYGTSFDNADYVKIIGKRL